MINVERFLQLINKGEGSQIEFKVSLPSKVRELAEVIRICYLMNVGVESENVGVGSENVGVEPENVGVESESVSVELKNVGVDSENVGVESDVKLSKRQSDLVEILSRDGKVTAKHLSEVLLVTLRTVERDLSYLQKNGFIVREGSDRYGAWIVLKKR